MSIEIKSDILAKELNQGIVPLGVPKAYQYDAALVEAARAAVNQGLDDVAEAGATAKAAVEAQGTASVNAVSAQEQASKADVSALGDKILAQMKHGYGYPFTAATAAAMNDTAKIYVYMGSETGYTNGNWYYWNGTAWVSGGVYNAVAFETDETLSISGEAADAKVTGELFAVCTDISEPSITRKYIPVGSSKAGQVADITNDNFRVSDFIPIPEDAYRIALIGDIVTQSAWYAVAFYYRDDGVSGFISGVTFEGHNIYASIPNGAKFVVIASNTVSSSSTPVPYDRIVMLSKPKSLFEHGLSDLSAYGISSRELTLEYISGQYISTNPEGRIQSYPSQQGFKTTGFIALQPQDTVVVIDGTNIVTANGYMAIGFYESASDVTYISGVKYQGQKIVAPIPGNARYVVFSSNTMGNGTHVPLDGTYTIVSNVAKSSGFVDKPSMSCPAKYDLVVGDTFELFFKGIVNSFADDNYCVIASCDIGSTYTKRFIARATTAGTYPLQLKMYDNANNVCDTKTINLVAKAVPSSPNVIKNILCVGDSLTVDGVWVGEFKRRLTGSGGTPGGNGLTNIQFIGTCENHNANYEGYGGWSWGSYNGAASSARFKDITCANHDKTQIDQHSVYEDANGATWSLETIREDSIKIIRQSGDENNFPATGTLTWVSGGEHHSEIVYTASANAAGNPFWDTEQNKVDFLKYFQGLNVSGIGIDYVYVLLGWNGATNTESTTKTNVQTFIDNVHASYPNAKIVLMGLEIPARDGLGKNYAASRELYSNYVELMTYVHTLDAWYNEIATDNSNVYHINISGQFDTEHNMQTATRSVNTRNTEIETYQSNGVHPAESGYLQIADAAYRNLVGLMG